MTLAFYRCAAGGGPGRGPAGPGRSLQSATEKRSRPSRSEAMAPTLSLKSAADHLDRIGVAWTRQHNCGSCHTNYPFLMARPALREFDSQATGEVRAFLEKRVAHWDDAEKPSEAPVGRRGRRDGRGPRHQRRGDDRHAPPARPARPSTGCGPCRSPTARWDWLKCGWPPLEHDDYYGAVFAALGVGHAPDGYATSRSAREGLGSSCARTWKTPGPRPAPPDVPALGLDPPRRPDGHRRRARQPSRGSGAPARRRRLEPALARQLETARRHAQRPGRPQRRLRHRPGRLRAPPGRRPRRRPRDPARRRLAQGQPARLGPLVHPVAERRQGPLHRRRRDLLRRDGPAPVRARSPAEVGHGPSRAIGPPKDDHPRDVRPASPASRGPRSRVGAKSSTRTETAKSHSRPGS